MNHTVEKIGGTSMSQYAAVRDNIILGNPLTNRILVVSAYGGMTDLLLEHKKSGEAGVYAYFAADPNSADWREALMQVEQAMLTKNAELFNSAEALNKANDFIKERLIGTRQCLENIQSLCGHGHFSIDVHLLTVREMLASLGEAHSSWNMVELLKQDGIDAQWIDLTGWNCQADLTLDERITQAFEGVDLNQKLCISTGYTHCRKGLMATFDRGYSEMTFSRIAVLTEAQEALIHKEYHLSSADPKVAGESKVVPIGRTNYDVADQLANLGMEAIHPKAAKGLRQNGIPLRVKNTFEPEHNGTLITGDYVSEKPCVEIIAGRKHVVAIELFDQDMMGAIAHYEDVFSGLCGKAKAAIITKDVNANTLTYYLATTTTKAKGIELGLQKAFPDCEVRQRKVAVVSAIGSDMQVPGILAQAVTALASANISVLAIHQSMRQVDMQFIVDEQDYNMAIRSLHERLIEVHGHEVAICAA